MRPYCAGVFGIILSNYFVTAFHWTSTSQHHRTHLNQLDMSDDRTSLCPKHSALPGDPSLTLITNADLGTNKLSVMKACSKAIVKATGKPEQWVAVTINDKADLLFGGSDAPAALGNLYSIGAINRVTNGAIHASVSDILAPFGVSADRIYINFFDMDPANIGWNRATFAD